MLINKEVNNLGYQELLTSYNKLEKRLKRIMKQGDRQQKQLQELNEKLNRYIELVDKNVIISITDKDGYINYISEAFCKITGYTKNELIGKKHDVLRDPNTSFELYEELWSTLKSGNIWRGEFKNRKKDGGFYWISSIITPNLDDENSIVGYTSIVEDITDKKIIEELSITDGLTSLYNRRHFNTIFPKEINRAIRENHFLSFLIMDVDNFKKYNDTYGHQKGDSVLKEIGSILKKHLNRSSNYAFRLGGEEFGAIFSNLNINESLDFANGIRKDIENLKIEHKLNVNGVATISMGLVVLKDDFSEMDTIYKIADEALYLAKESGRNRVILGEISG